MKTWLLVLAGILLSGLSSFSDAAEVYLPHLTSVSTGWTDYLQANNAGSEDADFKLTLYNNQGQVKWTGNFTVPAKGHLLVDIKKETSISGTTGVVSYTNPALGFRLSYEYQTGGLAEFYLADELKFDLAIYFSDFSSVIVYKGAAIANMTRVREDVTLYAVGGGEILGRYAITINPFSQIVGNPSTWFPDVNEDQVEMIIAVADSACLDGIGIGSDLTLAHLVFTPGQKVVGFEAGSTGSGDTETTVYLEQFSDNLNEWVVNETTDYWARISGGWYLLDYYDEESSYYWWNEVESLNPYDKFTIEAKLKSIESTQDDFYGLSFGLKDIENLYDFSISADGWFGIYKQENGTWEVIEVDESTAVNKGNNSINELKVKRSGSILYFYVNDKEVHSMVFEAFPGSNIGFHIYSQQKIAVDYLRVKVEQ